MRVMALSHKALGLAGKELRRCRVERSVGGTQEAELCVRALLGARGGWERGLAVRGVFDPGLNRKLSRPPDSCRRIGERADASGGVAESPLLGVPRLDIKESQSAGTAC